MNCSNLSQISDLSENHALIEDPLVPSEYHYQVRCFEQFNSVKAEKEKIKTIKEMQSPNFVQSDSKTEEGALESDLVADVEDHQKFDDSLSTIEEISGFFYELATSHELLIHSFSEPADILLDGIFFA